jgi:hypothetical protein
LRLRVDAQSDVYIALPARRGAWEPQQVLLDGEAALALGRHQEWLMLALTQGRHDVVLEGAAGGDRVDLSFGMPVHSLEVAAPGWQVSGVRDGQVPGGTLQLQRVEQQHSTERSLQANEIAPFVRVRRTLAFGIEWTVSTEVERIAPQQGTIHVAVDVLPGEAVTESEFKVEDGVVQLVLAPGVNAVQWQGRLPHTAELRLKAAQKPAYVERWNLEPGPQWHMRWDGLRPIKGEGLEFLPWPGDTLTLEPVQPAAVSGAAQTVESLLLESKPGRRAAEHTLQIALRASQAGEYRVRLPEGASVQSLLADGVALDTEDTRDVVLPVHPGVQQLQLSWREGHGIATLWRTPEVELSTPAANLDWQLQWPSDRWLLWLSGPAIGPAMLYWGVLLVIVALALMLGRVRRWWPDAPPLTGAQWLLLGIGMSTENQVGSIVVVVWLFALAARGRFGSTLAPRAFQLMQLGLAALTLVALLVLLGTIPLSLLSSPDMQVQGNGSWAGQLQWYQDRSAGIIPRASLISLPLWVYRLVMLAWSLWLAWKLVDWLRWGWRCFAAGHLWKQVPRSVPAQPVAAAAEQG